MTDSFLYFLKGFFEKGENPAPFKKVHWSIERRKQNKLHFVNSLSVCVCAQ